MEKGTYVPFFIALSSARRPGRYRYSFTVSYTNPTNPQDCIRRIRHQPINVKGDMK
jgi:hypothetical protein